jgi:hypothetical protein
MSALRRPGLFSESPRRLLAAGGVALVLLLSVLGSNPELHRCIHGAENSGSEDGCAVVLFAHGLSAPFDTAVLAATPAEWSTFARPATAEVFVASPRYLHVPGRGPPLS